MRVVLIFLLLLLSRASSFPQNHSLCPTDSLYNLTGCFTYFSYRMSWAQAQGTCQQHGLCIITIQNFNEVSAIAPLIKNYQQKENIWIRLKNSVQNSQWKVIHQPEDGQDKTLAGQGFPMKEEVCVELVATEGFLKWDNLDCQERRPFLCQTLPLHSKFWRKESEVTKLRTVTENNEQNQGYNLAKYGIEIREKSTMEEHKKVKESLFTNDVCYKNIREKK